MRRSFIYPLVAGALLSLAFAPIKLPGFAMVSVAWLFYHLTMIIKQPRAIRQAFSVGWLYGLGVFAAGTSWIYISIHVYGQADPWVAGILTGLFCLFMGLYLALFSVCFVGVFKLKKMAFWIHSIGFSVLWVIGEFVRAHLFTGFPWLLLGFSQVETSMKYLAPIIGVYGLSFLVAWSGCLLGMVFLVKRPVYPLVTMLLLYIVPQLLVDKHWTQPDGDLIAVSIIQGNVAENEKWTSNAYAKTIDKYMRLTRSITDTMPTEVKKARMIIWPEGAMPVPYPQARFFLERLSDEMAEKHVSLVIGIPYANADAPNDYYNALMVLGESTGEYFKHHLVPFGEYLPSQVFTYWTKRFNIAVYETRRGEFQQPLLNIADVPTLPFICYEIAYADKLFAALPTVKLLMTLSDDAWFGHSMARAQHVQMAQMRSLQSGRYQIVATNNGISAIINDQGRIIATVPSFTTRILQGDVQPMSGSTLWSIIGDNQIMYLLGALLFIALCFGFVSKNGAEKRTRTSTDCSTNT